MGEALSSGLPVVAYGLSTLDEIFGDSYYRVPVGDTRALAEATLRVLQDDGLVNDLSITGRKTAERYDLDRVAEAELKEVLVSRRR